MYSIFGIKAIVQSRDPVQGSAASNISDSVPLLLEFLVCLVSI